MVWVPDTGLSKLDYLTNCNEQFVLFKTLPQHVVKRLKFNLGRRWIPNKVIVCYRSHHHMADRWFIWGELALIPPRFRLTNSLVALSLSKHVCVSSRVLVLTVNYCFVCFIFLTLSRINMRRHYPWMIGLISKMFSISLSVSHLGHLSCFGDTRTETNHIVDHFHPPKSHQIFLIKLCSNHIFLFTEASVT